MIVVQRDLTQAPYLVYLKMEIQLNGRTIIRTSENVNPSPISLDPGIPTVISGSAIYAFFDPQNMDFVGYSRDEYLRSKVLPEGAYTIIFTAYDYARRDVALSSGGAMYCYLAKAEPPLLNYPLNRSSVPSSQSQFVNFQWFSRTASSPNSAFSTKYRFDLYELRLDGRSAEAIVESSRPVYSTVTDKTNLSYTIADPSLETGMRYAWRVKAYDTEGRDNIRNNGYSEVFSFVYGVAENTVLPDDYIENFRAEAIAPRKAKLTWDGSSGFDGYKVFYRRQGSSSGWMDEETIQSSFELGGLVPGSVYDCRVQGKKNSVWGGFSETDTVLMPMPAKIICGSKYQQTEIINRQPLLELMGMQTIDAGGFTVTVIDAVVEGGVPRQVYGTRLCPGAVICKYEDKVSV